MPKTRSCVRLDTWLPWCLALLFFGLYTYCAQANPHGDAIGFLFRWCAPDATPSLHHPGFVWLLTLILKAGRAVGLLGLTAGLIQAAGITALSLVLFYRLLRRHEVSLSVAAVFAALLGLNGAVLENATCLELYAFCLLAVLWSLHAFHSLSLGTSLSNKLQLWLSCVFLFSLHVGFGIWVLAIYLVLFWRDRKRRFSAFSWLGQGLAILGLYSLWLFWAGMFSQDSAETTRDYFSHFWRIEAKGSIVSVLLRAPLFQVGLYSGLLILPAAAGWRALRTRQPGLWLLGLLTTILFFACFAFWKTDRGTFYMPLMTLWGLFSARAVEALLKQSRMGLWFLLGLPIYAGLFLYLPQSKTVGDSPALGHLLTGVFLGVMVLSFWIGKGKEPAGSRKTWFACGGLALLLSAWAYLPFTLERTRPDAITRVLEDFAAHAPGNARLVTAIWNRRAFAQTDRECLQAGEPYAETVAGLNRWLADSRLPHGPPVFFDTPCYEARGALWIQGVSPPLERCVISVFAAGDSTFYRVGINE